MKSPEILIWSYCFEKNDDNNDTSCAVKIFENPSFLIFFTQMELKRLLKENTLVFKQKCGSGRAKYYYLQNRK